MAGLRLFLVRHGVTGWNREQRLQGHSDVELDPEGREQALRVGARLSALEPPLQAVYSSDLKRAIETAEAIARPLGLDVIEKPQLRETMMGDWEGLTYDEIIAKGDEPLLTLYRKDSYQHRPPGAEPMDKVWDRMCAAAASIREAHPTGAAAIVGHGGSLRVLLCDALNAPLSSMKHIWLSNAGVSIIEEIGSPERPMRRVVLMNDTSHLE